MHIDWWTLDLQTINLLVLLWILGRFLFRPLAHIVAERQAEAAKLLDDATAERTKAEQATQAIELERQSLASARASLLEKARSEAEAQRAALLETARAEGQRLHDDAEAAVAQRYAQDEQRIGDRATLLAADIARRLLDRVREEIPIAAFLGEFEQAIAALPAAARATIGAERQPVTLTTAYALSDADTSACRATLGRVLDRSIEPVFAIDPALIAGIRLETPGVAVDNSLHADLDHIAAELRHQNAV
jgi:F-type H+-transporting ATPase subunit b